MLGKLPLIAGFLVVSVLPMTGQEGTAAPAARVPVATKVPVGTKVVYESIGGQDLSLYVIGPSGQGAGAKRPAMLFFHGGAWVGGPLNEFDRQAEYLAGRGVVCIQVEYRFAERGPEGTIRPSVQDAKSAMRWVRAHAGELGIDPHRVGASGGSAGGQLAAYLGMMTGEDNPGDDASIPFRPDLMVLFNPAIDLGPQGCCPGRAHGDYKAFSPLYHVHGGVPPTLILQGDADKLVPPQMIQGFVEDMKKAGNEISVVMYPGVGHGFFIFRDNFYLSLEQADRFLAAHGWISGSPDEVALHKLPPRPVP
ncbi:MAG: alpha/beta hydrolase [Acidobacteriota bacterium]